MKTHFSLKRLGAVVAGVALLAAIAALYGNHQAASIGIIGGADGPTAIFIAGEPMAAAFFGMGAALLISVIAGSVYFYRKRS